MLQKEENKFPLKTFTLRIIIFVEWNSDCKLTVWRKWNCNIPELSDSTQVYSFNVNKKIIKYALYNRELMCEIKNDICKSKLKINYNM